MVEPLRLVDAPTLLRMLRFALRSGAERVHFRPGFRPMLDGLGGPRELRFRQLTGDDTRAMARHLLERAVVPERLRSSASEAAALLACLVEFPGEALFEVHLDVARGGPALALDVLRPLANP